MMKRTKRLLVASGATSFVALVMASLGSTLATAQPGPRVAPVGGDAGASVPGVAGPSAAGADGGVSPVGRTITGADGGASSASASAPMGDAGASLASSKAGDGGAMAESASTGTGADGGAGGYYTPTAPRKSLPSPPAPKPEQLAAYEAVRSSLGAYESGARDYRNTLTDIIKVHYLQKKKDVLSELDRGIQIEKQALKDAQRRAIVSLEKFVAEYSGPRAHPESTPDAMYRLAALYEERARSEDAKDDISVGLRSAVDLYRRIIREFPDYRELGGVYYFLGHAYNDSGRTDEAQQVWRSLVCHNHFEYPTPPDPKQPDSDSIKPLPQDNTQAYWVEWRRRYPTPDALKKRRGPDTSFLDPYPADCKPLPQALTHVGEDPKYVQEVWWQIGNWEFDQLDLGAGLVRDPREPDLLALPSVYGYNRAASAYTRSLQFHNANIYGVALYKYAWTLFKQQRYEAATKEFVRLLNFTDEQQKLTGDPGSDFRAEAYTYIAGSLTNVDFKGPEADEPFIPRPDVVEESETSVAERLLHVAIDRLKDPNLIPQDRSWTIDVYKGLASEFRGLNHFQNAIEVYELVLAKWPMDPSAPEVQASIADTYDQMNGINNKPGTPEHDRIAGKALEARTALANYIGSTPWVEANKNNPAALQSAERLVKGALRVAAVQHTNNARQALAEAQQSGDAKFQVERLSRARAEYELAALGWAGFIRQDENAPDAYESRYWLADARHNVVRIKVILHKLQKDNFPEPTVKEIESARAAAVDVRDSNEDDKYLVNAGVFVVDLADVRRDLEYQRFTETGGSQGVEERAELKVSGPADAPKVVKDPIPPVVIEGIQARDEYVQRVPTALDVNSNAIEYQFYAAERFFLYGHFDEAQARFEPMYKEHCGKDKYGYIAWEKLITMSNRMGNVDRSRQLAEEAKEHSCAITEDQRQAGALIVNPTLQEAAFVRARTKFKEAQDAPAGDAKQNLWREAAGMYEAALAAAPARDEAPEAAMNAAYAYKQVGDFNKAIDLYSKFISEYGNDARLDALQKGDPKTKKAPDPKRYEERLNYLGQAYDALSSTYYGFFNYIRAAETFDRIGSNERFDEKKRKDAARNAMILYANMGQRQKMMEQAKTFLKLRPTPEEKANADFLVADYEYKQWNPQGADSAGNKQTRLSAEAAHQAFYTANKGNPAAAKYALESAHKIAKMKKAGNDAGYRTWFKNTIAAWDFLDKQGAKAAKDTPRESLSPPYSDYGAEAEYTLLDEEIREKFDYETNHHRYAGAVDDIVGEYDANGTLKKPGKFQASVKDAGQWKDKLDKIATTYKSVEWTPAIIARQGTVYDSIRTALYETRPPALKYFTPQQEALLKQLENSGREELQEKADAYRDQKKDAWRERRDREIGGADEVAVNRYVTAVTIARQFNVRNNAIQHAVARLAYLENVAGEAKMAEYVGKIADPTDPEKKRMLTYTPGMFIQARSGMTVGLPPSGRPNPIPVAP